MCGDGGLGGRGAYRQSLSWWRMSLRYELRMLSMLKTKQCSYLGTHSRMLVKSCSFCSRVFLVTCVRWNVLARLDLGMVAVGCECFGGKGEWSGSVDGARCVSGWCSAVWCRSDWWFRRVVVKFNSGNGALHTPPWESKPARQNLVEGTADKKKSLRKAVTPHPIGGGFFHDRCGMVERTLTAVSQFRVRVLPQNGSNQLCPSHWLAEACHQLKAPISVSKLQNHHLARRVSRVKVIVTIKNPAVAIRLTLPTICRSSRQTQLQVFQESLHMATVFLLGAPRHQCPQLAAKVQT